MYAFVDRPVESLSNSGRFLLWAMRGWTQAAEAGHCAPRALRCGFAGLHALTALPDFHVAMALFANDARDTLLLAPLACRTIAEDEAILLGLWRDVAHDRAGAARATLALLVEPGSAGPLATAMTATTMRLGAAGVDLARLIPSASNHQESRSS